MQRDAARGHAETTLLHQAYDFSRERGEGGESPTKPSDDQ